MVNASAATKFGAEALRSTAESNLSTARGELATLQATTAAAQATVTALGNRILRADAQLAELATLVKTSPDKGTLDEVADVRVAEYNAFADDGVSAGTSGTMGEAEAAK